MFKFHSFKYLKLGIGLLAVMVSVVFAIWLLLLMFGYHVDIPILGMNFSFANYIRILAEIVIGSLLLAALAFL